ncbi:MAG: hypothetical protein H0U16_01660 [Actinobacteria bacterium]|nr:hypothetical protein [Actinomycetota bacterium]
MNEIDIARLVKESRRAQGLPDRVEDPEVLRRVAELIGTQQQPGKSA